MQITFPKLSRQEREEFFRKNKWLIHRLWGIMVSFPEVEEEEDQNDGLLQKHSSSTQEELEEQLEELEDEIEETLEDIEEDLDEMVADGQLDEEEAEYIEELGDAIDDLQEALEEEEDDKPDDLTQIKGLGPKTAEGLLEEGITSFQQVADLTDEQIEALDEKIRNFAKSYERKDFRKQAKDLA